MCVRWRDSLCCFSISFFHLLSCKTLNPQHEECCVCRFARNSPHVSTGPFSLGYVRSMPSFVWMVRLLCNFGQNFFLCEKKPHNDMVSRLCMTDVTCTHTKVFKFRLLEGLRLDLSTSTKVCVRRADQFADMRTRRCVPFTSAQWQPLMQLFDTHAPQSRETQRSTLR